MNKVIKSITKQGIKYIDEQGNSKYVDFVECHENWIQYRKRTENLTEQAMLNLQKSSRCIGQRDICAKPCYIEFFTKPFIRFEFRESMGTIDPKTSFRNIHQEIVSSGWTTIDLS